MGRTSRESWIFILDDVVMIALALLSVVLLIVQSTSSLTSEQTRLFSEVDTGIALVFLAEFCIKLILAPRKRAYLRSNWWLLLASIPVSTPWTQALRALRLLTILRLGRILTGAEAILNYCENFFTHTRAMYVLTVFGVLVVAGAALFELLEFGKNPAVHGYVDSLWWAVGTVTTSGSGDVYPVTDAGKVLAVALMIGGIGLSGIFTALVASFILREVRKN